MSSKGNSSIWTRKSANDDTYRVEWTDVDGEYHCRVFLSGARAYRFARQLKG